MRSIVVYRKPSSGAVRNRYATAVLEPQPYESAATVARSQMRMSQTMWAPVWLPFGPAAASIAASDTGGYSTGKSR
jgi:hypothetical protein